MPEASRETATMTMTAERYTDLVRRSGLVPEDQLQHALDELQQEYDAPITEPKVVAKRLLESKLITPWQNEKLMHGRHRGFFLAKYKLLRHLAKGGMSELLLAEHMKTKQRVVIKIFPPQLIERSSYLQRFKNECKTLCSLDHPNVVKAFDFGAEGKIHYLVMEYVDGADLGKLVQECGPLPIRKAVKFIARAAEALQYAHDQGMVHRDIKPGNLMIDRQGGVKLLDLGLARIVDDEEGSLTLKHNENSLGTADYISPEQAVDSHRVDERADIYSLGCTLYYLLSGQPPFPEGTPVQRMMAHMNQEPADIKCKRSEVDDVLQDILKKMTAKKPEQRYQTASEARRALVTYLKNLSETVGNGQPTNPSEPEPQPPNKAPIEAPGPLDDSRVEGPDELHIAGEVLTAVQESDVDVSVFDEDYETGQSSGPKTEFAIDTMAQLEAAGETNLTAPSAASDDEEEFENKDDTLRDGELASLHVEGAPVSVASSAAARRSSAATTASMPIWMDLGFGLAIGIASFTLAPLLGESVPGIVVAGIVGIGLMGGKIAIQRAMG